jgi:serine protease AprX
VDFFIKPDIVAPGNLVVSLLAQGTTLPTEYPSDLIGLSYYMQTSSTTLSTNYFSLSGTSMATPVVSGAVADLLEAEPSLTPDQVKAKLMRTAYKTFPTSSTAVDPTTGDVYVDQYDAFTVGSGYLDLAAALADTTLASASAMSPVATWDPVSGNAYFTPEASSVWGSDPNYSLQYVWGNTILSDGSNALWGSQNQPWGIPLSASQSVWGPQSVWGNQSVWGTQSIFADQSIWGTQSVWGTGSDQAASVLTFGEQ